jgi:outer membrane protein assembly factor BamB
MVMQRYIIQAALIAAFLLMYFANMTQANESNWPQFRGPNCSGHAAKGQDPPVEFGLKEKVIWKTPVLSGHSSPCIWGDKIFLTGFDKEKKELQVFCLDRISGNIQWNRVVPTEQIEELERICSPAQATPAADGERFYIHFGSYGILCYDFVGNQKWKVPLPIPSTKKYGAASSPIVVGNLVILNRDELNDPYLLGVDRQTGKTVWKQVQPSRALNYSTPIVWGEQLVVHRAYGVVAHKVANGTRVWSVSINTYGTSTPVIGNNVLFVGACTPRGEPVQLPKLPDFKIVIEKYDKNGDNKISNRELPLDLKISDRPEIANVEETKSPIRWWLQRIDLNKDSLIDQTEWKGFSDLGLAVSKEHGLVAIRLGGKGDVTSTHVLRQEKRFIPEVPSPLYHDGRVYMIKDGGTVSCMDAKTEKLLYRERLGAAGLYCSSPIYADGRIYIASRKGIITVFKVGDTLEVLAKNDLKEQIFATPAIVDNKLYVRTVKHMYAFGE